MSDPCSLCAPVLVGSAIANVVAAIVVWRRRRSTGRHALCLVLLAGTVWSLAYALELTASTSAGQQRWGDSAFVGTTVLPAAWLIFALQYAGRVVEVGRGLLAVLAVEPLVILSLLAYPPTRTLVHSYPSGPPQPIPTPRHGVAYWLHFVYSNLLVLIGSAILLITMMRISRLYRRQSYTLLAVICLPLLADAIASLQVPPFEALDPTPIAITLAACVLVFGVLRYRLLDLRPVARTLVVETMRDAVFVIDAQGRVVDLNPAAQQLVGRKPATVVGCPLGRLLGEQASAVEGAAPGSHDVRLEAGDRGRDLEVTVTPLKDPGGATAGRVLVLRDVSVRRGLERDLRRLAYTDSLTG